MRRILVFFLISVSLGQWLPGHETFLRPDAYRADLNQAIQIRLFTGNFERSVYPAPADQVESLKLHGRDSTIPVKLESWETITSGSRAWGNLQKIEAKLGGTDLRDTASFTLSGTSAGSSILALQLTTARVALEASKFKKYLAEEVHTDLRLEDFGFSEPHEIITERYTKHCKAVIQIGDEITPNVTEPVGQTIEIVPLENPALLSPGDILKLQVIHRGKPLANTAVMTGRKKGAFGKAEKPNQILRTNEVGIFSMPIETGGVWWCSVIYIFKAEEEDEVDFVSEWASLTFEIH